MILGIITFIFSISALTGNSYLTGGNCSDLSLIPIPGDNDTQLAFVFCTKSIVRMISSEAVFLPCTNFHVCNIEPPFILSVTSNEFEQTLELPPSSLLQPNRIMTIENKSIFLILCKRLKAMLDTSSNAFILNIDINLK
ncbi:hypothetical protein JCM19301_1080 [Jejuia pallidilutea]|nr:hypothetical protein JCM19301_1080 [Jejuia pallidilutea]